MRMLWIVGLALLLIVGVSPAAAQAQLFTITYYNTSDLTGSPVHVANLSTDTNGFYLNWGINSPVPNIVNHDNWSARFETDLVFEQALYYIFTLGSDDGVRLYVDNILVFDRFITLPFTSDQFIDTWSAGTHYIVVEYFDAIDLASLYFYWRKVTPNANLLLNSNFDNAIGFVNGNWSVYSAPTAADITFQRRLDSDNWLFEFYRAPQPVGGNAALLFQNTGVPIEMGNRMEARFRFGNSSNVRKRTTILVHDGDFSDFFVCSFWIPPNTPLQNYRMLGSARETWFAAYMSIYAASPDGIGWLQVDDVELYIDPVADLSNTLCIDPEVPPPAPEETPEAEAIF